VYLLLGDDEERKARSVKKLGRGRSAQTFDASEDSPEAVVSACNSGTLFGDGTFVVVRDLDSWNANQKAVLVGYLQDPAPDADLVLLGRKLNARERLLAAAREAGEVHTFEQPTGKELVKWAVKYAGSQGVELPPGVAQTLVARCAEDKVRLTRELDKLALYCEGEVTPEAVELLVAPSVESNIFAFVDALAAGDRRALLDLLERLFGAGEPPLRVVFMVRRQFNLIARARALSEEGTPPKALASQLKVPPFVARKLVEQAGKLSGEQLEAALALVLDLEQGLKGGSDLDPELQVELAVMKLSR
jgi:DNA polymerase III subunit delta